MLIAARRRQSATAGAMRQSVKEVNWHMAGHTRENVVGAATRAAARIVDTNSGGMKDGFQNHFQTRTSTGEGQTTAGSDSNPPVYMPSAGYRGRMPLVGLTHTRGSCSSGKSGVERSTDRWDNRSGATFDGGRSLRKSKTHVTPWMPLITENRIPQGGRVCAIFMRV